MWYDAHREIAARQSGMEGCRMTRYEFSLRQEVLLEKGAFILADLFRCEQEMNLTGLIHSVQVMCELLWTAKQDILL